MDLRDAATDAIMDALAEYVETELGQDLAGFEFDSGRMDDADWVVRLTVREEDGGLVEYIVKGVVRVQITDAEVTVTATVTG